MMLIRILLITITYIGVVSGAPPTFTNLPASVEINESEEGKETHITVEATDPDGNDNKIDWEIVSVLPSPGPFRIRDDGDIENYEFPGFDAAIRPQYIITVRATDEDGDVATGQLTVNIIADDNAPVFTNMPGTVTVLETAAVGSDVFDVQSHDADGDDRTYFLKSSVPPDAPFFIVASSGKIKVSQPLDYFTMPSSWILTIEVTDLRYYVQNTVTINLVDVEKNPVIDNLPATTLVYEAETIGRLAYIVAAHDDDNDPLTATMSVSPSGGPFSMTWLATTGEVSLDFSGGGTLDYESITQYLCTVVVTDDTSRSTTATLTVSVNDVNESPSITNLPAIRAVTEDETTSRTVYTVAVTDPENDAINYDIMVNPYDGGAFRIQSDGRVQFNTNPGFNYESVDAYAITVFADDGTLVSPQGVLYVNVTDVNEPPLISNLPATVTIAEDIKSQRSIFWVNDNDPDIGDTQAYVFTIVPASGADKFVFNSDGTLTCQDNPGFNYESQSSYTMTITVTDAAGLSSTGTLNINIQNRNEPPVFVAGAQTLHINEEIALETDLGINLAVTDPDLGDNITYALFEGNGAGYIYLDESSAPTKLRVNGRLDYDSQFSPSVITAVIIAQDSGLLQTTLAVTIIISDIDDNAPVFLRPYYTGSTYENRLGGTKVITVSAQDNDKGAYAEFTYSISGSEGNEYFQIDENGKITVKQPIDAEVHQMINFTVLATSTGGEVGSALVYISILDENDHRPYFAGSYLSFDVRSDAQEAFQIGAMQAFDEDISESGGVFRYQLYGTSDYLSIDDNGHILVKTPLPEYEHMVLHTVAYDNGVPTDISEITYIRVDTYIACENLLSISVLVPPVTFDDAAKREDFVARLGSMTELSGSVVKLVSVQGVAADTYQSSDGISYATVMSILVLKNKEAEEVANIDILKKKYFTVVELEGILATSGGSAAENLVFVMGSEYPIEKLNASEACPAEYIEPIINWWLDTHLGRFTIFAICFGGFWLLVGLISTLVYILRRYVCPRLTEWRHKRGSTPLTEQEDNREFYRGGQDQFDFRYKQDDPAGYFKQSITPVSS